MITGVLLTSLALYLCSKKKKLSPAISVAEEIEPPSSSYAIIAEEKTEDFNHKAITREIEAPKSGQKGKLSFLNYKGEACSTKEAFKDYAKHEGWNVMRAELSFWQAMFCFSFWDEIFEGMRSVSKFPLHDIPRDLFEGESFYLHRKQAIDNRYEQIKRVELPAFINGQIRVAGSSWTHPIYDGTHDMMAYSKSPIVQEFISRVDPKTFAKIVYRIAQNPNKIVPVFLIL